nr:helix-turn-helix domain-containing protein [Microbacterium sp. CFH 90308]
MAVQTLYNLISQGQGPKHYKQGKRNAFYPADLDDWIGSRLQPATEAVSKCTPDQVVSSRYASTVTDSEKRGYTVAEASAYLGISDWVLRAEMRNNRIAAKRRGSTILFDRHELDRYFDDLPERMPGR